MGRKNGKTREVGLGKETTLLPCTQLQIQQQFIKPSLHEIKKIKTAAEKAAESLISLQQDNLHVA